MSLNNETTVATYEFDEDAMGLSDFISEQMKKNDAVVVYVLDDKTGNTAKLARFTKEILTDNSEVFSLYIKFDD